MAGILQVNHLDKGRRRWLTMMGSKDFQEKLFYDFSLSKRIPEDHLLRRLEEGLDLSFVRELTAPYYSHTGQPSVDPVVLFKMMLMGYLYGITSERRLAEEISLNMAYMWYLGYDLDEATPNHSVISKARARYGKEVFEEFFSHVVRLCMEVGLINGEKVFIDSTLIEANASLRSIEVRQEGVQPQYTAKEFIDKVFQDNPVQEEDRQETVKGGEEQADEGQLELPKRKRGRITNKTHQSRTDPEASLVGRPKKGLMIAYKDHFTVNESRVITAVRVTPAAVDDASVVGELLGAQPVVPKEFCGDSHYGVPEVYEELLSKGIQPVIPRRSPQARRPRAGRFSAEAFQYEADRDVFVCPAGKELRPISYNKKRGQYHYRPRGKQCRGCRFQKRCSSAHTIRTVVRYRGDRQQAIDSAMQYLKTPEGEKTLAERYSHAEWAVAEAKGLHGLRRAMFRGLEKVTIQALMTAAVQNIKRLMKQGTRNNGNNHTVHDRNPLQQLVRHLIPRSIENYFAPLAMIT
jgi:transposase